MMFEAGPHLAAGPATMVPDGNTIPVPDLRQPDLLKKLESRLNYELSVFAFSCVCMLKGPFDITAL